MSADRKAVLAEAVRLARRLPPSLTEAFARILREGGDPDWPAYRAGVSQAITPAHHRAAVAGFLDYWRATAPALGAREVAAAVEAAAIAEREHRESQSIELVWTGPDDGAVPLRRTEQAILEIIDSATTRTTVVSYAVYKIPFICDALIRAAGRGVSNTIIVETPDRIEGERAFDTLAAFGPRVASRCSVLYWPKENRAADESGKVGILHVKCIAADGRWLCLSSANLTEYAFSINMELGVLVRGGSLPRQVEDHFDRLAQAGVLRNIHGGA